MTTKMRSPLRAILLLSVVLPATLHGQEATRSLTLDEALELARENNPGLEAVRQRVEETRRRSSNAFTNYLPRIETQAAYLATNNAQGIILPSGSLGYFSELGGRFPRTDRTIPQGGTDIFLAMTTVAQPLTQYFKIREGRGVLRADQDVAMAELRQAEQALALGVLQAYAGLLIAERGAEVARVRVAAAEERTAYLEAAVQAGSAPEVAGREARVNWLQARQALLALQDQIDDVAYALTDAVGLPAGTRVEVTPFPAVDGAREPLEHYVRLALGGNPDVVEARALTDKATHGVGAARAEYIPDVSLMGGHLYQNSFPFFPSNTLGFGVIGTWTILDFGARRRTVQERGAQLRQAEGNVAVVEGRIRGEVEAAYRRLIRADEMVALAREALSLRTEGSRLRVVEVGAGLAVPAQEREAAADRMEAELDLLRAELGHRIAVAELAVASGLLGR